MIAWLSGKKTYIVAGLMAMVSLSQLLTGEVTFQQFIAGQDLTTLMEAIGFGTLRAGIAKRLG